MTIHVSFASPFQQKLQPRYRCQLAGAAPGAPSHVLVRFEPAGKPSVDLLVGQAEVDPESAIVLRISAHPAVLPEHVDTMDAVLTFDAPAPAERALSKVVVESEGGFLFFHVRVRKTLAFTEHRKVATASP